MFENSFSDWNFGVRSTSTKLCGLTILLLLDKDDDKLRLFFEKCTHTISIHELRYIRKRRSSKHSERVNLLMHRNDDMIFLIPKK